MTTLATLPAEIVENIARFLEPDPFRWKSAMCNLRLVCTEIEAKTFRHFATAHFKTIQLIPSKWALEILVAISESRIASFVKILKFGPEEFDQGKLYPAYLPREDAIDENTGDPGLRRALRWAKEYASNNRQMRTFGFDLVMLEKAFKNLRCCQKLEFSSDGLVQLPIGENHVRRNTMWEGEFRRHAPSYSHSISRMFTIALQAAQAASLPVESIICIETGGSICTFRKYPLDFPLFTKGTIGFPLLRTFNITIGHPGDLDTRTGREDLNRRLLAFLSSAPGIKILGFDFDDNTESVAEFLNMLIPNLMSKAIKGLEVDTANFHEHELWASVLAHIRDGLDLTKIRLRSIDTSDDNREVMDDHEYEGPGMKEFLNGLIAII